MVNMFCSSIMVEVKLCQNTSLRGVVKYAKEKLRGIYSFMGIPYAEPPTGKLRFRPPQPLKLWEGQKDCTKFGKYCNNNNCSNLSIISSMKHLLLFLQQLLILFKIVIYSANRQILCTNVVRNMYCFICIQT